MMEKVARGTGVLQDVYFCRFSTTNRAEVLLERCFACGRTVVEKLEFVPQGD